jgi:hypothetical protein
MMIFTKTGSAYTLLEESFEGNDIPESWEIVENSVGGHLVLTAGIITDSETEAGRAYITHQFILVTYESNSPNVILRSPLLNGAGKECVTVSFDWEAGGEKDATEVTFMIELVVLMEKNICWVEIWEMDQTRPLLLQVNTLV